MTRKRIKERLFAVEPPVSNRMHDQLTGQCLADEKGRRVAQASRGAWSAPLPGWELRITRDYAAGSAVAGERLAAALRGKPDLLLCAASGHSPTRGYAAFVRSVLATGPAPAGLRLLKLDEWGGLAMNDPASCEAYLRARLVRPLGIHGGRFISFQSDAASPEAECRRIDDWLARNGPIDVCVLGLGLNGHLGLNEPAEALSAGSHVARLTAQSLLHPMLAASQSSPGHGLTLGMRNILESRTILLLVFGTAKAAPLERLLTGGISSRFPASFLTLHPRVRCICDEAAAMNLPAAWREGIQPGATRPELTQPK